VALQQNYPNPFNPSTVLRFDLPVASDVHMAVYDLLGRAVQTVADGAWPAGSHEVRFDAGTLPSGAYLVRLEAGGVVRTRKIMLLR
jgi:glucuronoarabinoxylan endo-1,4-beta-xylanase